MSGVALIVALPALVYYLWASVELYDGALFVPTWDTLRRLPAPTPTSLAIYLGWFAFHSLMQLYAPGRIVLGAPLADGTRLPYKLNGWLTWWVTWALLAGGVGLGVFRAAFVAEQLGPLFSTVNLLVYPFALFLYFHGKRHPDEGRAERTGDALYDYCMGTSLNPRTGSFDWKLFCEARPGLIGWVVLDVALAARQHELHGSVSTPMLLVCAFHFWYVADYYFHEEAILTTWDIKHENFGFMLAWGDLAWVPFTYTLQARYLLHHHEHEMSTVAVVGVVLLNLAGYLIFRGSNIQKHRFRQDAARPVWGRAPEYIRTRTGSLLLTSGWWGVARHMNYLGDLMMGLAWCVPTGFGRIVPYFYIIYFTVLLVHRERRDGHACQRKYGPDWDAYCARVRWRIVPGLY